jgi:hypothetical protein
MLTCMRPRMYFDVDDRLRWAMRLAAAHENFPSVAQLIKHAVEQYVAVQLAEVDKRIAKGESAMQGKSPRGRKPKQKGS